MGPNLGRTGKELPGWTLLDGKSFRYPQYDPNETLEHYPLELLVTQAASNERDKLMTERMLRLPLQYGANSSAWYETITVMHRLIPGSHVVRNHLNILWQNPSLDLEACETHHGMTLLSTAYSRDRRRGRLKEIEQTISNPTASEGWSECPS